MTHRLRVRTVLAAAVFGLALDFAVSARGDLLRVEFSQLVALFVILLVTSTRLRATPLAKTVLL